MKDLIWLSSKSIKTNLFCIFYFLNAEKKNEFHFLYLWVYLWNLLIWLKCEYLMWDSIWCIFLLLVLLCVFYFWSFGYVKDSVSRFAFLIVGSFMVFCFDFLIRKKTDTKFTAKSILWMICRMRIKLGVPFWKILYDWVQNLLRQIYFVSFTFLMLKKKKWVSFSVLMGIFMEFINLYPCNWIVISINAQIEGRPDFSMKE